MLSIFLKLCTVRQNKKNKQEDNIWSLKHKKQKFGTTMQSPEDLENTPFNPKQTTRTIERAGWKSTSRVAKKSEKFKRTCSSE